jgi:uncharacterized protein DUF2868
MPSQLGLADLIDLEYHLLQDPQGGAHAQAAGDRVRDKAGLDAPQARRKAEGDRAFRTELCTEWLADLHRSGVSMPGARVEIGLRAMAWILTLAGLLVGGTTAAAALAYDGSAPVNLWMFLAIFVLLQIALLVLMFLALGTSMLRGRAWMGFFSRLLSSLASSHWLDRLLGRAAPDNWRLAWRELNQASDRLQSRRPLYRESERWLLFQLVQRFGLYFNVGAVVVFGWLLMFSDLAFAWSTTPAQVDSDFLTTLVDTIALPWSWISPDLVPDQAAIEATRWSRLDGAFLSSDPTASALHAAGWWPFLFLSLLCWGLLPRFLAWSYAGWRARKTLRLARLDHAGYQQLYNHMLPMPMQNWAHPDPSSVQGVLLSESDAASSMPTDADSNPGSRSKVPSESSTEETTIPVLIWGDWIAQTSQIEAQLLPRFGWRVQTLLPCGGVDESSNRLALAELQKLQPARLALIAEGGESPDKRLLRFLRELRSALRPETTLLIGLIEPDWAPLAPADLELWQRYLASLHDPYLRVEALT